LDVPAIIGYVTKTTGAPKMHWVGHSQGGGVLVEALALDPSLKDRLSTSALLAPGVHMAHLMSHFENAGGDKHGQDMAHGWGRHPKYSNA